MMKETTTETEFETWLKDLIDEHSSELDAEIAADTFRDAGVLTMNKGLVIRKEDGSEFQLTIVKSR